MQLVTVLLTFCILCRALLNREQICAKLNECKRGYLMQITLAQNQRRETPFLSVGVVVANSTASLFHLLVVAK